VPANVRDALIVPDEFGNLHTRILLMARGRPERCCGDEAVRRERCFVDAEEEWRAVGGLAAAVHRFFVLFHEAEAIDLLVHEEIGVADACHAHRAQHLTADDFDVFVVDDNRLRAVNRLDLVDRVALQLADAEDGKNVVRIRSDRR
jgi:hypothetical protein